jgi:hypothetical protein
LLVELLIFFIGLCALAFLATRFGYDSRSSAWSKEAEMGTYGMTWAPHDGAPLDLDSRETADMRDTDVSEPPLVSRQTAERQTRESVNETVRLEGQHVPDWYVRCCPPVLNERLSLGR